MNARLPTTLAGAIALCLSLGACAAEAPAKPGLADAVTISYASVPLSAQYRKMTRVGRLIYRGGLELSSPDARFGGWSGLVISADGKRLLSQSDEAHWLRATLVYDLKGDLAGIEDAQLADMLDENGHSMDKAHGDAEGLDGLTPAGPDGAVAVSFERDDRVWYYDLSHGLDAKPEEIATPGSIKNLESNLGLEGLTLLRPGTLFAVSEAKQMGPGMPAWLIPYPDAYAPAFGRLDVIPHAPYQISDAAMGPSGKHLYLLERHYYGPVGGIVIAVREIDAADVKPGARLDGKEIAQFDMRETIDNMEGLALRRDASGRTFLYMISDDNYNPLQRTLLLMFELSTDDQ